MNNKNRRLIAFTVTFAMIVNTLVLYSQPIFAHEEMLEVTYDDCISSDYGGDMNEMWYILNWFNEQYHLSQDEHTIRYYFEDSSEDGSYTWTTDISESEAQEIKEAYANSMKKWNNVYFYSYNDDGSVTKNKIINVVEGNENNCNLKIYPSNDLGKIATTGKDSAKEVIETGEIMHNHYQKFNMTVYVNYFYEHTAYDYINSKYIYISEEYANIVRERTGAHELGHVLGLYDVDYYDDDDGHFICGNANATSQHHEEILMGYGSPITSRSQDITYKDIAGVAITRGFHTDNDHKWLYCGQNNYGKHRLLCSICNGFKEVDSLNGYIYDVYGYCNGSHTLSSGHMMAVASYGTKDYYKCKYCRYVAPFSSIVDQEYSKTNYSHTHHKCVNNVSGLLYTFYEQHNIVNNWCSDCNEYIHSYDNNYESVSTTQHKAYCECGEYVFQNHVIQNNECIACGEPHTHDYSDHFVHEDSTTHKSYCICGGYIISGHVVSNEAYISGKRYATCLACGGMASLGMIHHQGIGALPRTGNGSFILPDGIIVLVDEDIEAYLVGTLEFIYPDGNLETE